MAWIAVYDVHEPYVFDDQTGERVAVCLKYQNMHEPPTHAWHRACLIAEAPKLHNALVDLLEHARHSFSPAECLQAAITDCEKIINTIKETYDNPRPR